MIPAEKKRSAISDAPRCATLPSVMRRLRSPASPLRSLSGMPGATRGPFATVNLSLRRNHACIAIRPTLGAIARLTKNVVGKVGENRVDNRADCGRLIYAALPITHGRRIAALVLIPSLVRGNLRSADRRRVFPFSRR